MSLISLSGISKNFGSVQALKDVTLSLEAGEILALVGENGAGKSTLMKILSGLYPSGSFSGKILVNGAEMHFHSPKDSEQAGVSLIHQELSNFPHLTVAENMVVGHWPQRWGLLDEKKTAKLAQFWLAQLDSDFSPSQKMSELSTGQQQVVEIAKALSRNSKVLILDEPTSSLSQRETKKLFALLKELKAQGCGLIYISHRMEEIFSLADRVCVIRDGHSVITAPIHKLTEAEIVTHMVGRSLQQLSPQKVHKDSAEEVLLVKNFAALDKITRFKRGPISFSLKKGEILGFAGLLGAGRSEILQALAGDEKFAVSGEILYKNSAVSWQQLRQAYQDGLGLVPEDRKIQSLFPNRSLTENAGILRLSQKNLFTLVSDQSETERTFKDLKVLNTRFSNSEQKITELSGGNQQKVVFSRILQNAPDVLILDEPTRGVDVGAKFEIYQLMRQWTAAGKSILLVSSDLPELMNMSDRVLVMSEGRYQTVLAKKDIHEEIIMKWALGNRNTNETVSAR